MTDVDALRALLARVEAVSTPSAKKRDWQAPATIRDIEQDLYCEIGGCPVDQDGLQSAYRAPSYLSSLDAAVGLIERVLPGWEWNVGRDATGCEASVNPPDYDSANPMCGCAMRSTPALALVSAAIRGVIASAI